MEESGVTCDGIGRVRSVNVFDTVLYLALLPAWEDGVPRLYRYSSIRQITAKTGGRNLLELQKMMQACIEEGRTVRCCDLMI